jgi:dihydrofolate reductase
MRSATDAQRDAGLPRLEQPANWDDTRKLSGELGAEIAKLKAESGKDLLAHGGASFARSLVRLGLVDEYRLLVHPTVLGSGIALLDGAGPFDLKLVHSTTFANGVHALVYLSL